MPRDLPAIHPAHDDWLESAFWWLRLAAFWERRGLPDDAARRRATAAARFRWAAHPLTP